MMNQTHGSQFYKAAQKSISVHLLSALYIVYNWIV